MNRIELCTAIAQKTGLGRAEVEKVVEALTETVTETLKANGEVTIAGFGAFLAKERKGRLGVNPRTKEKMDIAPVRVAKFRVGINLKKALKGGQGTPSEG